MKFLPSTKVEVFPSGFRGEKYGKSRLTLEENFTNLKVLSESAENNSYLMKDPYDQTFAIICIHGYRFRLPVADLEAELKDCSYVAIALKSSDSLLGNILCKINNTPSIEEKGVLDDETDGSEFHGLVFYGQDEASNFENAPFFSLKYKDDDGNILWSSLKLNANEIRNTKNSSESISEKFETGELTATSAVIKTITGANNIETKDLTSNHLISSVDITNSNLITTKNLTANTSITSPSVFIGDIEVKKENNAVTINGDVKINNSLNVTNNIDSGKAISTVKAEGFKFKDTSTNKNLTFKVSDNISSDINLDFPASSGKVCVDTYSNVYKADQIINTDKAIKLGSTSSAYHIKGDGSASFTDINVNTATINTKLNGLTLSSANNRIDITNASNTNTKITVANGKSLTVNADLNVNAGVTVNTGLAVNTGSVTLQGNAAGSTLALASGTLNLPSNPSANSQVMFYNGSAAGWKTASSDTSNNTIVTRDGSGNFSAGIITATLDGLATRANYPEGFGSRSTTAIANSSIFTAANNLTGWMSGDAYIKFAKSSDALNVGINGYYYQNNGSSKVVDEDSSQGLKNKTITSDNGLNGFVSIQPRSQTEGFQITGGGKTLTVVDSGTAALLGVAQTFTADKTFSGTSTFGGTASFNNTATFGSTAKFNGEAQFANGNTYKIDTSGNATFNKLTVNNSTAGSWSDAALTVAGGIKVDKTSHFGDSIVISNNKKICWDNSNWGWLTNAEGIQIGYGNYTLAQFSISPAASTGSSSGSLRVTGGIYTSAGCYFNGATTINGEVTSTTGFNVSSDIRLKENIKSFKPSKSILDLDVKEFDYKESKKHSIGCIAQELKEICPEIVHEDDNGYLSIEESKIIYLLLDEVKKLRKELDELKG